MSNKLQNINLNLSTKQKFTVDGNADKIIELDTNDLGLVRRLSNSISSIHELESQWKELEISAKSMEANKEVSDEAVIEDAIDFSNKFTQLEQSMCEIVDTIFDSENLCDTLLDGGSIFSIVNGKYKYEQIIDVLIGLYEKSIKADAEKINKRKIQSKTQRYIR
jgi:hypothetical protein